MKRSARAHRRHSGGRAQGKNKRALKLQARIKAFEEIAHNVEPNTRGYSGNQLPRRVKGFTKPGSMQ